MLTKSQYKMFCTKSIFGFFKKKKDCVVQAQLGRCIMSLETRESSISVIVIQAKGTILHFTIREFALVTGLNCATNKDEFVFDEECPNRIIDQYFDGESFVQKKDLFAAVSDKIWGNDNNEDALKFVNLYFIHAFLLSNCDLYMVTYAECLTFSEGIPSVDFDPDLIRIRYASLLWDYGTKKAKAKAQSDDEAPMRPLRITELTEGTEVVDI
ncbi:hypothetical protein BC332_18097 [Capsicum chinense]|nr:hypothetical protein BC332_18097 [Capsicum chinense]